MQRKKVIVIGDSTNNTLSVVRSLGRVGVDQTLILKCDEDVCNVVSSRYLKHSEIFRINGIDEVLNILRNFEGEGNFIICTFDEAAEWIDRHEQELSKIFITPCRGMQIGNLFDKANQCKLAENCGLTIPKSIIFDRKHQFPYDEIPFPLLLKPLESIAGEKSDIHICRDKSEIKNALESDSNCTRFVVQEFIEKEYELDCIGISTDDEVIISGAIRKIRHYPPLIGAGAYGKFIPITETDIDVNGVEKFIRQSNYHGPFSVEFLHTKNGQNYFMEVNFRNEGLAFASTVAGANLHAVYAGTRSYKPSQVKSCYMMNYSLDFLYVKNGEVGLWSWLKDFIRTRCYINFSFKDPMPTVKHYWRKIANRICRMCRIDRILSTGSCKS